MKASMVPQADTLANLGFPAQFGDRVWLYRAGAWSNSTYSSAWMPDYTLSVAEGFFLSTPVSRLWIRDFVVPFQSPEQTLVARNAVGAKAGAPPAEIQALSVADGYVVLTIKNDRGAPYHVQFSPDGVSWTTVATNLISARWREPARSPTEGYYQLVNP